MSVIESIGSDDLRENPYAMYERLRQQPDLPTFSQPIPGFKDGLVVSRYHDVMTVLKDPRFSNERRRIKPGQTSRGAWWMPPMLKALVNSMVMVDDPDHTRLRHLVHKAFTPRMIQQMDARIEHIAHDLLDKAADEGPTDLMSAFALPLPLTVISEMMGVAHEDRHQFHHWAGNFIDSTGGPFGVVTQFRDAVAMNRFFRRLIQERRENPQDDLTSALVAAEHEGDKLDENELVAMLFLLLLAGHETTVNLIGNGTLALLQHPQQFEQLKHDPALMDTAIEEMLRYTNPVQQVAPRYALEHVELSHGQVIPEGRMAMALIASANFDETAFDQPEVFDITRSPNRHMAFGFGIHYCLGAPLARLEAKRAFEVLFDRYPNLSLAVAPDEIEWRPAIGLKGLRTLPVHLSPALQPA